jgi:hypothetical protein
LNQKDQLHPLCTPVSNTAKADASRQTMNPTLKIQVTNATGGTLLTTIKTRYESLDKTILSLAAKIVDPQVISLSITKIDAGFDINIVSRDSSLAAARNLVYGDEFTMETETT